MAVTYSATPLGAYSSALRNSLVSQGAAGGSEAMTLVHGLGACPTEIRVAIRSLVSTPSGFPVPNYIVSMNASQAVIGFGGPNGAVGQMMVDVIAEVRHSIVS